MFLDIFTVDHHKVIKWHEQNSSTPNLLILKYRQFFCRAIGIVAFRSRLRLDLQKPGDAVASPKRKWYQITPETLIEKASRYGNFSQPM